MDKKVYFATMNETTKNRETESICSSWFRFIISKLCAASSLKNKTIDIDDWCHIRHGIDEKHEYSAMFYFLFS